MAPADLTSAHNQKPCDCKLAWKRGPVPSAPSNKSITCSALAKTVQYTRKAKTEGIGLHARSIIQKNYQSTREHHEEPGGPDLFAVSPGLCNDQARDGGHNRGSKRVWDLTNACASGRVSKYLEIEGDIVRDGEEYQSVNDACDKDYGGGPCLRRNISLTLTE